MSRDIIRLGKIKNGKLVGIGKNAVWGLDYTLAIFIRDTLYKLADSAQGYPAYLTHDYIESIPEDDPDREQKINAFDGAEEWDKILRNLAKKFDFYLKNSLELITPEEDSILEDHHNDRICSDNPNEKGYYNHIPPHPDVRKVYEKIDEIEVEQLKIVREAFDELKEIFPTLWS